MFGNKVYELPLARDYVSRWGVTEAVRELLQNAIDSPAPFEVTQSGSVLTITSRGVRLEPSTLVLGRTSKADDASSIGQFGEGYKLALLVLCREAKKVSVISGKTHWTPEFRVSGQFGIETLHIIESRGEEFFDGVRFRIYDLNGDEQAAIKQSCLLMQPQYPDTIMTPHGDILPNLPGKLFVGGLYVCDTQLNYGYNLNAGEVELERDRQTVANWDLRYKTKNVWLSTMDYDHIAEMVEKDMPDVNLLEYSATEIVKEACYKHFVKHRGTDVVIAKTQKELNDCVERGMKVVIVQSSAYHSLVSTSRSYKQSPTAIPAELPAETLTRWFNENHKYMPRIPATNFKRLLEKAQKWRNHE